MKLVHIATPKFWKDWVTSAKREAPKMDQTQRKTTSSIPMLPMSGTDLREEEGEEE